MEKFTSVPSLSPNNKTTTTTNPSQLVVDQDDLDKLSNQLKLLKIDDLTINKILKKFKPIKNEVKSEPTDCEAFEAQQQQQPFVGYDGLFELAISQVIQCGYGHVLPSNIFGTKKRILKNKNSATNLILIKQQKIFKMRSKNINKQLKLARINLAIEQTKTASKIITKKGGETKGKHIDIFFKNYDACMGTLISDTRRPLKRKLNEAEVLAPQENSDFNREASVAAFTPPPINRNFSGTLNDLANAPTARTADNYVTKRNKTGSKTNNGVFEVEEENESATEKRKKKKKTKNGDMSDDGPSSSNKEN